MRQLFSKSLLSMAVCALVLGLSTGGCGKKDDTPAEPNAQTDAATSSVAGKVTFARVKHDWGKSVMAKTLDLWEQGSDDEALAEFVKVDFGTGAPFDEACVLSRSNRDIELMDAAGREAAMEDIMSRMSTLQGLCGAALEKSEQGGGAAYSAAVGKYADAVLGQKDVMALVEMVTMGLKQEPSEK